jgi:hypothetical protein
VALPGHGLGVDRERQRRLRGPTATGDDQRLRRQGVTRSPGRLRGVAHRRPTHLLPVPVLGELDASLGLESR